MESKFSTPFAMCKLLILQGSKVPKTPLCRVHRTPIVHGAGEYKANIQPRHLKVSWFVAGRSPQFATP